MARYKKTILSFFIILLILLGIKHIVLAADTGKANEDAKLRKSMDDTSIILEIIPKNDEFEILEEYDDWYKVNYMKIKGYVKKLQVEIIKKEDSNDSNTTNEIESQNTNDIQTNEVNSSIIENNDEQEEIKVNDKLYVKSEINLFLRPLPNSMKIQTLKKNQ